MSGENPFETSHFVWVDIARCLVKAAYMEVRTLAAIHYFCVDAGDIQDVGTERGQPRIGLHAPIQEQILLSRFKPGRLTVFTALDYVRLRVSEFVCSLRTFQASRCFTSAPKRRIAELAGVSGKVFFE